MLRKLAIRRMGNLITRGGALFLLALLLTGAGAFLSANNLLFLVFSSMMALLLVSGFLSRLVLSGLELELLLPEHVSAQTPSPAVVRLRNLKRLTPSFSIELAGRKDPLNSTPSILGTPVYFPLLPGRSFVEAAVNVTFPYRGRHHDSLFVLSTKFPFGFLRKSTRVTLRRETIVYPSLEPTEQAEALLERVSGEMEGQVRGAGSDFYRIRPYEMTDSARLVDWKSTAHTGELQVREFSREEAPEVEIFLDRRMGSGAEQAWFEKAVSVCAFLAWNLAEREVPVRLRAEGHDDVQDVYEALRFLALVQPLAGGAASQPERPASSSGISLAITCRPDVFEEAGWSAGLLANDG